MTDKKNIFLSLLLCLLGATLIYGCNAKEFLIEELTETPESIREKDEAERKKDESAYYDTFFETVTRMHRMQAGTNPYIALDDLPKSPDGEVNWTVAVLQGFINPRGSLDPDMPEMEPLSLTTFIEAKTPLMSNVYFPHSIHTYWLSCNVCHPQIFIPKAGANPITMDEIFQGKWCGRCHGKVAFNFYPMTNCRRCHAVMKGKSLQKEHWR